MCIFALIMDMKTTQRTMMSYDLKAFFCCLTLCMMVVTSCKEDNVYNQNDYDATVKAAFPVKNVDATHTWSSVGSARAFIQINGSSTTRYTYIIYDQNPIESPKSLTVLGQGAGYGGSTAATMMNYILDQPIVYVALFDGVNYMVVYKGTINNGVLSVTVNAYDSTKTVTDESYIGVGTSATAPTSQLMALRFLFEDEFPEATDYDFNDCVFSIAPSIDTSNPKKVTLTVRAEACGTTKCMGAAVRLKNITTSMLSKYSCTKAFPIPPSEQLGEYKNIPDGEFTTSKDPNDKSSLVILLFKDMHWVLKPDLADDGGVQRYFFNTQQIGKSGYAKADVQTANYVLEFNSEQDARKMMDQSIYDAFVVESYNGSYWEIHTVQNGNKGALVIHSDAHASTYDGYLNAYVKSSTGNYPWVLLVSGTTAYPYEWIKITEAYSNFAAWGQNQSMSIDWHRHRATGNTYPL